MTPEEWSKQQRERAGKSPRRQAQGYKSREVGNIFESYINASCEYYDEIGAAFIEKTPEPMKVIERQPAGRFTAVFTKKAQPDFKGTLDGGHAVCFDAKHTDSDRIMKSAVTDEQEKCLNKHESLGAVCFVLVSIQLQKFYRVPWAVWKQMQQTFGHKFMTMENLSGYRLNQQGYRIMFLEPQ